MKTCSAMLLCLLLAASVATAQEWSITPMGGEDMAVLRLGYTPEATPRVTVGLEGSYLAGIEGGPAEGGAAGFWAAYDLVQDAEFDLIGIKSNVSWYIGGHGDLLFREGESPDPTAGLMTGLVAGNRHVPLEAKQAAFMGVEGQYLLTAGLWRPLAEFQEDWRLLFFAGLSWK